MRDLDRYLWLSDMYRAWERDHDAELSGEVRSLFASRFPDAQQDLAALVALAPQT